MDPNSPVEGLEQAERLERRCAGRCCTTTPGTEGRTQWMDPNSPVEGLEQAERLERRCAGRCCTTTPGTEGRTHRLIDRWTERPPGLRLPRSPPSAASRKNCNETIVTFSNEKMREITRRLAKFWGNGLFTPVIVWTVKIASLKYTGSRSSYNRVRLQRASFSVLWKFLSLTWVPRSSVTINTNIKRVIFFCIFYRYIRNPTSSQN